jgi:hypothetical protein
MTPSSPVADRVADQRSSDVAVDESPNAHGGAFVDK